MSLSEKHTSIYNKKLLQGIKLVFCDRESNRIAALNLSNEECGDWKHQLKKIQEKI